MRSGRGRRKGRSGRERRWVYRSGPRRPKLRVVTTIKLKPIPTGVYHLLDEETDPLLTVAVKNESQEPRRICVTAFLEGLSARRIKTVELGRRDRAGQTIHLLPSLIPEQARRITEIQRCTLHVEVVDLEKKVESQDTHSLVLLARNSSFNSVVDPVTTRPRDLTKYYAASVTPHVEPVQALVRKAAEKVPGHRIWGYQGRPDPEATATQVKALFDTLKEAGIAYIDSDSHDFEAACQRARNLYQRFFEEDLVGDDGPIPRVLKLNDLRAQSIWPME
jgi:hypothetical protein